MLSQGCRLQRRNGGDAESLPEQTFGTPPYGENDSPEADEFLEFQVSVLRDDIRLAVAAGSRGRMNLQ